MGVHGLWRLLDSFGSVIQPDDLKGKRVAIDASIWIAQFRARIAPDEDVEHKVLEGFLGRILKLLFYGIKPVFVFDGQASSSKGAEHHRRMRLRAANAAALLRRRAKQILMAQVAAGTIDLEVLRIAMQAEAKAKDDAGRTDNKKSKAATSPPHAQDDALGETIAVHTTQIMKDDTVAAERVAKTEKVPGTRSPRNTKRRRDDDGGDAGSAQPPRPHRHRHRRRRRCRIAPEAVSNRSTLHFLNDVEGLLEERAKQEARVMHNALHNTSTSLFMGPRRAVEDGGDGAQGRGKEAAIHSPASQRVFVVEEDAPAYDGKDEVVSVTDSDVDFDDGEEGHEDRDDASSDCRAVSSSVVSVDGDAEAKQSKEHTASSRSPSNLRGDALLHSDDLARFFASFSQLTPPAQTPPSPSEPVQQPHKADENAHLCALVEGKGDDACAESEDDHRSSPSEVVAVSTDSGEEVHTEEATGSIDTSDEDESEVDVEEAGSESNEEGESSSASDFSDEGEEEEEGEEAGTTSLTWEPFTQRINPDLLLQHLVAARNTPIDLSATPPRKGAELQRRTTANGDEYDDGDYTPVKLGQSFAARPLPVAAAAASVVMVSSSDDDERSTSAVRVCTPPDSAGDAGGCAAGCVKVKDTAPKVPVAPVPRPTAAPRHNSTRSSVAVVPFELLHVVELLECCGVPYVLSPSEADAQCAFLARHGLVDAVFTEDSDVLVHGATTVLRGFFSQSKSVVAYKQAELAACGITKTVLVALASLLGCDYTDGVPGIGLVGALEALVVAWTAGENHTDAGDSSEAVLHVLRRWRELVRRPPVTWQDVDDDMSVAQFALFGSAISKWHLLEQRPSFPEVHAIEAFYAAEVDDNVTPFTWLPPDWQQIRIFAGALGALSSPWLVQRYELARKECLKREAEEAKAGTAQEAGQRRLTEFGAQERVRAEWAFQKQPRQHAAVLSQLRAVQLIL